MEIREEKIKQIESILREYNVDMWMVYIRETDLIRDPVLNYIYRGQVVWESAFIFTKKGNKYAIVGSLDKEEVEKSKIFEKVYIYINSFKNEFEKVLNEIKPKKIALNFSIDSPQSNGITHGLFLKLQKYLKELNWKGEIISAEKIINSFRSRKTKAEIKRIKKATDFTLELFDELREIIKPGITETEIASYLKKRTQEKGLEFA
jgi:Xaa-Pro aminopeptidase